MEIDFDLVQVAYRKLKRYVYYDKTDLRLRKRLAEFECASDFEQKLRGLGSVLSSAEPWQHDAFKEWLKDISYRIVPKKIKWNGIDAGGNGGENGRFITNVTSTPHVTVEKVNYFFDGPIELHLTAVLWIMLEGRFLDAQLGSESCGSRLLPGLHNNSDQSAGLFRKYHEQYSRWRDRGIRKAKHILTDDRKNVAILGLDIQEYFYRIRLDFQEVATAIARGRIGDDASYDEEGPSELLRCVWAISGTYRQHVSAALGSTHKDVSALDTGLPIGICSSLVLANWYLKNFDDRVKEALRPAYYGRYVDDILIVIPVSKDPGRAGDEAVATFMNDILLMGGLVLEPVDRRYELASRAGLYLQQGKCILQYFDTKHSIAGLEKFQKKLEENASDFLLMPVDEADNSMEEVAYELLYEGSVNKFRSVRGMAENRYELAKHLARQTILHLLTDDPPDPKISLDLRKFFKGKNAIEFSDLWERVFTFFRIAGDQKAGKAFEKHLTSEIKRVRSDSVEITKKLVDDLLGHLGLSRAMADALCDDDMGVVELLGEYPTESFRNANLIRHHFVRKPLLNYTTFKGALAARRIDGSLQMDPRKLVLTPRYVNFDECLLLAGSGEIELRGRVPFDWAADIYEAANRHEVRGVSWQTVSEADPEDEQNE